MRRLGIKSLALLAVLLLHIAVLPVQPATAGPAPTPVPVTVTASVGGLPVGYVDKGDTVLFAVSIGAIDDFAGFSFHLRDLPEGLEYVSGSAAFTNTFESSTSVPDPHGGPDYTWTLNFDETSIAGDKLLQFSGAFLQDLPEGSGLSGKYTGPGLAIATFECKATGTGTMTMGLGDLHFYFEPPAPVSGALTDIEIPTLLTPAAFTVWQSIPNVLLNTLRATVGHPPIDTVSGEGYAGTVSWSPAGSFMLENTYTATVTLDADDAQYYYFSSTATVNVPGSSGTSIVSNNGDILVFTATMEASDILYGDVDGNGVINLYDALYFARHLAGWPTNPLNPPLVGDMDGNGVVNLYDALYFARHLAGWPDNAILGPH